MQNKTYNTRSMVEAGLISALIVVLMLMNVYIPGLSIIGSFALPIPVTVLYLRHNYKVTLSSVIISTIIVAMIYSPIGAITAGAMYGLVGITLGYCIKKELKFPKIILYVSIAYTLGYLVDISIYASFIQQGGIKEFINEIVKTFRDSYTMAQGMYEKMGIPKEQLKQLEQLNQFFTADYILKIGPGILLLASIMSAYFNYAITKGVLSKLKYKIQDITPFSRLYVNNRVGAVIIIIVCLGIIMTTKKIQVGEYILNSSQAIFQVVFTVDGLAFITYLLRVKGNLSKGVTAVILVFAIFSQISILLFYVGLIDMIIDFRKIDPNRILKR